MAMPLWDDNPFTKPTKPWATWGIILLNIIVFFLEGATLNDSGNPVIVINYGLTPATLTQPGTLFSLIPVDVTLVTYMFLHADILHLFGNMIFLFVFGDDIEEAMGSLRFVVFYLACGIVGALFYLASTPQSSIPLIGASGACSGVIAAYLMLRPCAKIRVLLFFFVTKLDAFWVLGSWALIQIYQLASKADDEVAYWCHIGGFVTGAALFPLMRLPGVELFECAEHKELRLGPMPDSSRLPGAAPREPTIR